MKISNKTKYGFQFMLHLAVEYGEEFINIRDIAKKDNIPEKFLENIVSSIKATDLIQVKRGASGGYRLAKAPDEITLLSIFESLEGSITSYEVSDSEESMLSDNQIVISEILDKLSDIMRRYMQSKTLQDLVSKYRENRQNLMFYI